MSSGWEPDDMPVQQEPSLAEPVPAVDRHRNCGTGSGSTIYAMSQKVFPATRLGDHGVIDRR